MSGRKLLDPTAYFYIWTEMLRVLHVKCQSVFSDFNQKKNENSRGIYVKFPRYEISWWPVHVRRVVINVRTDWRRCTLRGWKTLLKKADVCVHVPSVIRAVFPWQNDRFLCSQQYGSCNVDRLPYMGEEDMSLHGPWNGPDNGHTVSITAADVYGSR